METKQEPPKIDREKLKVLYEYVKSQFEDEKSRYARLEDKSSKYLTSLNVAIPIFLFIFTKFLEGFTNKEVNCLFMFMTITCVSFSFLCFCSAWSFIFRSLKLRNVERPSIESDVFDLFKKYNLEKMYVDRARAYASAAKAYRQQNLNKTKLMLKAYNEITCATWSFLVSILLIILIKVL